MAVLLILIVVAVWIGVRRNNIQDSFNIIATNFAGYDFARTVTSGIEGVSVEMLLPPGSDLHTYEPTPGDIAKISQADLFIYNGGESEKWLGDILDSLKNTTSDKTIKMLALVSPVKEESPSILEDSHEHDDHHHDDEVEYDEHIWTSFENATTIVSEISDKITSLRPEFADQAKNNTESFKSRASALKTKYQNMINPAERKTIVFGDKFPLRYFADEMALDYYAAFPGCAEETEASPRTIAELVGIVKAEHIPVVFKIELSSGHIAETIAKETGAKVRTFNTMHTISQDDFVAGANFLDIMEANYAALEEALN